ncbi:MAG: hypothetical protein ACHP7D_01970 [Lysobacterales bacterium]|jgi:hypothetical protein
MRLLTRRQEIVRAEYRFRSERALWLTRTQALSRTFRRHRTRWIIGGGICAGLLTGILPLRGTARAGALLARVAGFALRLPIGTLLRENAAHPVETAPPMPRPDIPT